MVVIDLGKAVSPVSVAEVKAWLRIDGDDQDETLELLLSAASEAVESELGLAVSVRQFRVVAENRPSDGRLRVTRTPVVSVDAVLAYAHDGDETVLDAAQVASVSDDRLSIRLVDTVWQVGVNGVDVTVTAGLAPEQVPSEIKHTVLVAVATWFEMRTMHGDAMLAVMPDPARSMLRPLRRIGL